MRDQIFISYSHKDKKWLERLQLQLSPLVRIGLDVWDDTRIKVGSSWKEEIQLALSRARVGVLLVTPHYLASEFVITEELPRLLNAAAEEGLIIFWIAVSSSTYELTNIAKFQAANDPLSPLDKLRRHAEINEELVRICKLIRDAFNRTDNIGHKATEQVNQFICQTQKDSPLSLADRYDKLMKDYRNSLDPYLQNVFNELLQERIEQLHHAIVNQEIVLNNKEEFIHFYIKTLRHYRDQKTKFTATTIPSRSYFWDDYMYSAIREFIQSGGEMTRIFVVDDEAAHSTEANQVMTEHLELGVKVFTTHPRGLSRRLRSTFLMVEHGKRIAWEFRVKENTTIMQDITITTNPLRVTQLEAEIHHIHKIPYVPLTRSDGDQSKATPPQSSMPETWSPEHKNYSWIAKLSNPELVGTMSSILAVRQACYEDLWLIQRNPNPLQVRGPSQSECRMFSKAVRNLQDRYGREFPYEPLDDKEGYSTNPSPGWLLSLCDHVLAFVMRKEDAEIQARLLTPESMSMLASFLEVLDVDEEGIKINAKDRQFSIQASKIKLN